MKTSCVQGSDHFKNWDGMAIQEGVVHKGGVGDIREWEWQGVSTSFNSPTNLEVNLRDYLSNMF